MRKIFKPDGQTQHHLLIVLFSVLLAVLYLGTAQALTLTVTGADNTVSPTTEAPVTAYRWLIEEDKTYHVPLNADGTVSMTNNVPDIDPNWRVGDPQRNTLSVSFHHSYMPVVAEGTAGVDDFPVACTMAAPGAPCLDPTKNYFISVLPDADYSIGGAQLKAGGEAVTVFVNKNPIPTAQITVFIHEDIAPINNVWDLGETGLEGFSLILEDAGGKYGASAGIQSQDAFGNLLCTSYLYDDANGNGQHDPGELFIPDANGDPQVDAPGAGCVSGPDGTVTVRNLAPGKYGILAVPPSGSTWSQTSTIEGKKLIDAWVKADEPAFFGEFGPPGPHVSIGFAPAGPTSPYIDTTVLTGGATISGDVVNLHLSRPPNTTFNSGGPFPHTTPWVGLNMGAAGLGKGVYAARTDGGSFSIPNVPPGSYQLVVWDDNLDLLFAKSTVVVNADGSSCNALADCNLDKVPVFQWFARMEHYVFNDENENGFWDDGELPLGEQNVNLRWRDGTVYQAFPTDFTGVAPFDEVFPFFSWLVAEVDFGRFKATGATIVVDDGGPIDIYDPATFDGVLNPQGQLDPFDPTDPDILATNVYQDQFSRTELGPVLTQGFQAFLGQTNVVQWGKKAYGPDENGAISGMVMYAVTRAEDDPSYAAAEPWEPGIPGVIVNLYDSTGMILLATTQTDSWDDSLPTNCQVGANAGTTDDPFVFRGVATDCYDGLRTWNQVRPGVFDGGYAFAECDLDADGACVAEGTGLGLGPIPAGQYIAEVVPPFGYEVIKSQDRNVDFGDVFFPSPELLPPVCAGADYVVPLTLSLFPGVDAPLAGDTMKTCDRKEINLADGSNAAADFFLFTEVPIAGHFIGFILDDTANEFDPASPQFGEKYAPPFLPVSIRDWTGREISRTVSDEYGVYNALIPSTFTENLGQPSGISPNMLTTCMNAKNLPNGDPDPLHNPQYSQFCYTFQYMPGSTTYLDTPVVPVSAFAGSDQNPLDCEYVDTTPRIYSVDVGTNGFGGPYIPRKGGSGGRADGNHTITITSMATTTTDGLTDVPNPAYDGVGGTESKLIKRDYGFGGTQGQGTVTIDGVPLTITGWANDVITASVPNNTVIGAVGGRQLTVTRDNGSSTITGVTVQVGLRRTSNVITVTPGEGAIQAAINAASNNDLILVAPGTYREIVIMWKPVQLQGWGEGSVTIDAIKAPFNKLTDWRILAKSLTNSGAIDLVPGQELGFGGIEPATFFTEEGAGVFVLAKDSGQNRFRWNRNRGARIDGITISGADTGGGVVVNGYADYLDISNLRVVNNSGFFAGGVRVGHPMLTAEVGNNNNARIIYSDADNDYVDVHHNTIKLNGGLDGAGGGLALHTGSDFYTVTDNFVCGNFTTASGAGIAHYGLSEDGLIQDNTVIFNENFNQGITVNGGGILVAGLPAADPADALGPGTGSVRIEANLIQGNSSGVGDGAGIRLERINGQDINKKGVPGWTIDIINNMIVDNMAALSGGGISLQDALAVNILHNTIANNDNASTSGDAFTPGLPTESNPQPGAGIVSRGHSFELAGLVGAGFSDANLVDNIIWQNRMFYWLSDTSQTPAVNGLCPDISGALGLPCGTTPVYDDLAVIGAVGTLTCTDCIVTGDADPAFVREYVNAGRNTTTFFPEGTISAPPAFDEGGNFIRLRYGPLTQTNTEDPTELLGDYHIQGGSPAVDAASDIDPAVTNDFDGEGRPGGGSNDIGADEV